ncbi:adenosine receptor A2b-like [Megalops cyprinoides]|uniref:adenosine receptor A2b-like n=1 Tax=Megalops cyprinoides TaxID=118141 RepID=UPI0018643C84|nr:adenosine receptor A2b-like [Megalops cyprinoides]
MNTFYIIIELIIAVLSIAGNVLVCLAVATNATLKNATNYFLVSLAVADILVGCLAIPFAITISIGIKSDFYGCLFLACFVLVLTQSSIFSLLAVAVDRYLAVNIPLRYKEIVTGRRAREIIALLWILSLAIGLIPFLGWNEKQSAHCVHGNASGARNASAGARSCQMNCYFESVVDMHYMVYVNFFGCVLPPLLIMLVIYAKIFAVARQQLHRIKQKCPDSGSGGGGGGSGAGSHSLLQREIRAAKSLSIIVGLFALCWLPVHVLNCLTVFYSRLHKPPSVMYLAIVLSHANSVVNPIIYAYRIQDFRNTFRRILSRRLLCRAVDRDFSSSSSSHSKDPTSCTTTVDPIL